jgi:hypothetical protein
VLTKAADGSWNAGPIHLPDTEPTEVSTYRVQLNLTDDWSAPVAGQALKVTSSATAVALSGGRGVTLSQTPITFTTDGSGQVTIPLVAEGLWAPELTISGDALASPVTVSPSKPINHYMSGGSGLNYLPPLDGGVLAGASTAGGAAVFPMANQNKDTAAAAVAALASAATAAAEPTLVELTLGSDRLAASQTARHAHARDYHPVKLGSRPRHVGETVLVGGLQLQFGDLAGDALFAIKRGAAKVHDVTLAWDDGLKRWVGQVTADFDAWGRQLVNIAIHTLQDAADVFHSVVNYLGGVLGDVIDWLKAHVLALLRETVTLAARYDGWLLQLADELSSLTQQAKGKADKYFTSKEALVHQELDKLKAVLGSRSISSLDQAPQLNSVLTLGADPSPASPSSVDSHWMLDKLGQSELTPASPLSVDGALQSLVGDVQGKVSSGGQDFINAANNFRAALLALVSTPKDFGSAGVDKLLDAIGDVIDAALTAADLVVDVVLDLLAVAIQAFKSMITTPVSDLPLLGPLLKAAGYDQGALDRRNGHPVGGISHRPRLQAGARRGRAAVQGRTDTLGAVHDGLGGRRSQLRDRVGDPRVGLHGRGGVHVCRGWRRPAGAVHLGGHRRAGGDQRADGSGTRRRPPVHLLHQAQRRR